MENIETLARDARQKADRAEVYARNQADPYLLALVEAVKSLADAVIELNRKK